MPKKNMTEYIKEISQKDSSFMKRFGSLKKIQKINGESLFRLLGFSYSASVDYWNYDYYFSFRNVFEGAGFIVEPAYPREIYPYYNSDRDYYIVKSPFERAKTRSTTELHLLLRAFIVLFLKKSRDTKIMNKFIDELSRNSKIQEIDAYRLKIFGEIYLKKEDLRLGTFYDVVARNLNSKKVRNKLSLTLINSLKDKNNCIDWKVFKNVLIFFEKLSIDEAPEQLRKIDFQITDKKKKLSYTGNTFGLDSLSPYNPYFDKSGNLKLNKKSSLNLKKNTRKAQKVLKKHIIVDNPQVVKKTDKGAPRRKKAIPNTLTHIKYLLKKNQWSSKEIEEYAKKIGLMKMKFVLEINEYCDEKYGDFLLLESESNFTINKYVLENFNDSKEDKAS